jgi:hypothetical protein
MATKKIFSIVTRWKNVEEDMRKLKLGENFGTDRYICSISPL